MFLRYRNILPKNQIKKRFFSHNCNFNLDELHNVKKMLKNIYIMSIINFFITLVILDKINEEASIPKNS
jgi:hypothetical protein